jgi:hypothetical protein
MGGCEVKRSDQIIEIAKYCGWSMIEDANSMCVGGMWVGYPPRMQIIGKKESLPNYLDDLNAIHEAEKSLDGDIMDASSLRYRYSSFVYHLTDKKEQPFRASSKIRSEAFLRTIDKWIETNE